LLIVLSDEHTQGDALGCCSILYQEGDYGATPGDAILQPRRIPRNPSPLQGFSDRLDSSRIIPRLSSDWTLNCPYSPRLLKKVQMQGGMRKAE
jgi:hypothetical protein